VLVTDRARSDALRAATAQLQRLEDMLPYDEGKPHKRVRADIPVGVYDVVADFGQSRGGNTATILPNDAVAARNTGARYFCAATSWKTRACSRSAARPTRRR